MSGYVIFNTIEDFNQLHEAEKTAQGYPLIGKVNGVLRPDKQQTTEISKVTAHPTDDRAIAYINGGWREETKAALTFLTKEQAQAEGWFN